MQHPPYHFQNKSHNLSLPELVFGQKVCAAYARDWHIQLPRASRSLALNKKIKIKTEIRFFRFLNFIKSLRLSFMAIYF